MPDAPDRPASGSLDASKPVVRLGAAPPEPTQPYRALSALAMTGFAVAVFYTVLVLGGGLVSFITRGPWLLSFWAVVLPLAGLALSWVARQRIRQAEGTLSGASLTTWGIALSVVVGLAYGAYYAGTAIAIRKQATSFVENVWFDRINKGQLDKAYVLTLPPPRISEDAPDLRSTLETIHNTPGSDGGPGAGPFSAFCQAAHVRMLQQAAKEGRIELLEVRDWSYEKGGYHVVLTYRAVTPLLAGDVVVTVQSTEGATKDGPARQWHVIRKETGALKDSPTDITPEGKEIFALAAEGQNAVRNWFARLTREETLEAAFYETLPRAERFRSRQGAAYLSLLRAGPAAAGLGLIAAEPTTARDFRIAFNAFRAGALVKADPPTFWSSEKLRPAILADMNSLFNPGGSQPFPTLESIAYPAYEARGDRLFFRYPVMFRSQKLSSEGTIIASTRGMSTGDLSPRTWRIEGLEMNSGRSAPEMPGRGPGGPPRR